MNLRQLSCSVFLSTPSFETLFWRCRAKGKQKIGEKVKPKIDKIFEEYPRKTIYRTIELEALETRSQHDTYRFDSHLEDMFDKKKRVIQEFLSDLYDSTEDARQQLYFLLSLHSITKEDCISLAISWKKRKSAGQKNIAKFCHDAYWHAIQCERMSLNGTKHLNFTSMQIEEESIPFTDFSDTGLRHCTPKIKEEIEKEFISTWFRDHKMLDLTPETLYFICLIIAAIPEIDFAFLNPPWEPKIAEKIYPKIFSAWRENQIKELVWIGNHHWLSTEAENDPPRWFREAWKEMLPFFSFIEVKFLKENFEDGVSKTIIKGKGKKFCVVHCKRHPT